MSMRKSTAIYEQLSQAVSGQDASDVLTAIGMLASNIFASNHAFGDVYPIAERWCATVMECVSITKGTLQ